jgi:hyperosmotically inducible protein
MEVKMANIIKDTIITSEVKAKLFADPQVSALDIKVNTEDGIVKLSGNIDNQSIAVKALDIANNITGVTSVENHLTINETDDYDDNTLL